MSLCKHLGGLVRKYAPNCPKRDLYRCTLLMRDVVPIECHAACPQIELLSRPQYNIYRSVNGELATNLNKFVVWNLDFVDTDWKMAWDELRNSSGRLLVVGDSAQLDESYFDFDKLDSLFLQFPTVGKRIVRERLTWRYEVPNYWVDIFHNRPLAYQFNSIETWPGQHWPDGGQLDV